MENKIDISTIIQNDDIEAFKAYHQDGGSLTVKNNDGHTTLITAIIHKSTKIFNYLLSCDSKKIGMNMPNIGNKIPLYWAIESDNEEAVVALLEHPDFRLNEVAYSVSYLFALMLDKENCCERKSYKLLLNNPDFDPNSRAGINHYTLLNHALKSGNLKAVYDLRQHPKFCPQANKKILDNMAGFLNTQNLFETTDDLDYLEGFNVNNLAYHLCRYKRTKSMVIIMKHDDFDINDRNGITLLDCAMMEGNIPAIYAISESNLLSKIQMEYVRQWAIANGYIDLALSIKKPNLWQRILG
jgi:ankyrin repeat protein